MKLNAMDYKCLVGAVLLVIVAICLHLFVWHWSLLVLLFVGILAVSAPSKRTNLSSKIISLVQSVQLAAAVLVGMSIIDQVESAIGVKAFVQSLFSSIYFMAVLITLIISQTYLNLRRSLSEASSA